MLQIQQKVEDLSHFKGGIRNLFMKSNCCTASGLLAFRCAIAKFLHAFTCVREEEKVAVIELL